MENETEEQQRERLGRQVMGLFLHDEPRSKSPEHLQRFAIVVELGEVVAADASDGGYGHHAVNGVVRVQSGPDYEPGRITLFYSIDAGGCSCDGDAHIGGPFLTFAEAAADAGTNYSLVEGVIKVVD